MEVDVAPDGRRESLDPESTPPEESPEQPLLTTEPAHGGREAGRGGHAYIGTDPNTFPTFFGWPFYPAEVLEVANRVHPKKVSAAWCVGPVFWLCQCMPIAHTALAFAVAISSACFATCVRDGKELVWPWWLWLVWLPFGLGLLVVEYHVLRHLSVPYYFKMKRWALMPASHVFSGCCPEGWQRLERKSGFYFWLSWCVLFSLVRLFSFFSANMFIGMVLGDLWVPNKCSGGRVERIWHLSLQSSRWWLFPRDIPLSAVFIVMFVAQILHFAFGMLHSFPAWNQWNTKGKKPPETVAYQASPTYEQPLEMEIREFVNWRRPTEERPRGTRYVYVTLAGNEVTSSEGVEIVSEACGMAGVARTHEVDVFHSACENATNAMTTADEQTEHAHIKEALVKVRGLLRDARMVARTSLSHVFFYGLLLSGMSLQAQVTYLNARCFEIDEDGKVIDMDRTSCHDSSGLGIGVFSGFATVSLTAYNAYKTIKFAFLVRGTSGEYQAWYRRHESFIRNDHDELQPKHEQILRIRTYLIVYLVFLGLAASLFLVNFVWAATKWTMATYVCPDPIWDVDFPPTNGCVNPKKDSL